MSISAPSAYLKELTKLFYFLFFLAFFFPGQSTEALPFVRIDKVNGENFPAVNLRFTVFDNHQLQDYNNKNIILSENNAKTSFSSFKTSEHALVPFQYIVLVDNSLSLSREDFLHQLAIVDRFTKQLREGDNIALFSFSEHLEEVCAENNRTDMRKCFGEIQRKGLKTRLYDAMYRGLILSQQSLTERKTSGVALIVLTDGRDDGSTIVPQDIILKAGTSSVPVFVILTARSPDSKTLKRVSFLSGGHVFTDQPGSPFLEKFHSELEKHYRVYELSYISTRTNYRPIDLKLSVNAPGESPEQRLSDSIVFFPSRRAEWMHWLNRENLALLFSGIALLIVFLFYLTRKKDRQRPKKAPVNPAPQPTPYPAKPLTREEPPLIEEKEKEVKSGDEEYQRLLEKPLPPGKYRAYLVEKEGPYAGRKYKIAWYNITIGSSSDVSLSVHDDSVSTKHARIEFIDGNFFLYDLFSDNGVYLNGRKLLRPKLLHDFDEIRIGRTRFIFRRA